MNKTMFFITSVVLLSLFLPPAGLFADPITELNYQGRILADSSFFNDTGSFKFLVTNSAGNASYWSNDGSSSGGSEPTAAVSIRVRDGLYSVILGDSSITNMTSISSSIFANGNVLYLAVWFDDGTNGSQQLLPNEKIVSAAYAVNAERVKVDDDTLEIGASGVQVRRDYAYRENTYVVKSGGTIGLDCDYTDIQASVLALGSDGSIYVKAGIYSINSGNRIQVTADNVELIFEDGARMVAGSNLTPLTISGDYDRVSGAYVDMLGYTGTAIAISSAKYCRIEDGRTIGGSEGVGFYETRSCWVTEMDVSGAEAGIVIYQSQYSNASENKIMECTEGIRLGKESSFNRVENNFIFSVGKYGVVLYNDVWDNTVQGNEIIGVSSGYGIFSSAPRTRVVSNRINETRQDGIYFEKVRDGSICSNTCQYSGRNGIFLDEGTARCLVSGNRCYHNHGAGIQVEGEQNNIASNHTMNNGHSGIYLTGTSANNGVIANRTDTLTDSGIGNTPTGPAGLTQTDVNRVGP